MKSYLFSCESAMSLMDSMCEANTSFDGHLPQLPSTAPGSAKKLTRVLTARTYGDIEDMSIADIEGLFKDLPAYFQFFQESTPFEGLTERFLHINGISSGRRRVL